MVKQDDKAKTSFHVHTEEATPANTTKPQNDLNTSDRPSTPAADERTTLRRVKGQSCDQLRSKP